MRMVLSTALAATALVAAFPALAQSGQYETWQSVHGFEAGDTGGSRHFQGLTVSWDARPSSTNGRMYVHGEFCNYGGNRDWQGGMRLTHIEPDRAHLTIRVPAGECITRSEILPTGVDAIYIWLSEH